MIKAAKEVDAAQTVAIEQKTMHSGEQTVVVVQMEKTKMFR